MMVRSPGRETPHPQTCLWPAALCQVFFVGSSYDQPSAYIGFVAIVVTSGKEEYWTASGSNTAFQKDTDGGWFGC